MSNPHLPAELLDEVVDHLYDTEDTLRSCCLVSKSWIPRSRKHLFADINFRTAAEAQSWKNAFPDPSTSSARYAKALTIESPQAFTAADAEESAWIRAFSRVVCLDLDVDGSGTSAGSSPAISLILFHGFSLVLKSLRITFGVIQSSQAFNFICSFPLLEDLTISIFGGYSVDGDEALDEQLTTTQPSSLPVFTGTLKLYLVGARPIISQLLSLLGGFRFRKLNLRWIDEDDISLAMALVEGCCSTLQSLEIGCEDTCMSVWHPCLHQRLTSVCRRVVARFGRPLESDETPRSSVSE
jgi:hypothetical protein